MVGSLFASLDPVLLIYLLLAYQKKKKKKKRTLENCLVTHYNSQIYQIVYISTKIKRERRDGVKVRDTKRNR